MGAMTYAVKEVYFTLEGEGHHTGRPVVLLRFAGCNLWSGSPYDRSLAICQFCDTDFRGTDGRGGGKYANPDDLARVVDAQWPDGGSRYVVCTGGEPALQLDTVLIDALKARGFEVGIETNGTLPLPPGLDWVTVSPKARTTLVTTTGSELKLVYPQAGFEPEQFESLSFEHFYLQPMDGPDIETNTRAALGYCLRNPRWKLSLQTHKLLGIP